MKDNIKVIEVNNKVTVFDLNNPKDKVDHDWIVHGMAVSSLAQDSIKELDNLIEARDRLTLEIRELWNRRKQIKKKIKKDHSFYIYPNKSN